MEDFDYRDQKEGQKPVDLGYLLRKYLRFWPLYLLTAVVFLTAVFFYHRYTVDRFEVSGTVLVGNKSTVESRIFDRSNIFTGELTLDNDVLLLTSKILAKEALKKLHFDVEYYAKTKIKTVELYDRSPIRIEVDWDHLQVAGMEMELHILSPETFMVKDIEPGFWDLNSAVANVDTGIKDRVFRFGEEVKTSRSKFTVFLVNPNQVGEVIIFKLIQPATLESRMASALKVSMVKSMGSALELSLVTTVVEKGRDYINALMEAFIEYDLQEKNRNAENTLKFINQQLAYLEDSLKKAQLELQKFKVENKLVNVSAEFSNILEKMNRLEEEGKDLDFQLSYYESIERYIAGKGRDFSQVIAPSVVGIPDPLLNGLIQTLVHLSQDRRKLLAVVNDNHPEVVKNDMQMQKVQDALQENIVNLIANTKGKKEVIQKEIQQLQRQFVGMPESESQFSSISREFNLRENLYTYLLEKRAEVGIAKASNVSDNTILDYAKIGSLVYPNKRNNYLIALLLGIFLPLGFVMASDLLDPRIKDQRDFKNHFEAPLLGIIGFSDYKNNLVVLDHPRSPVAESFRSLRSAISFIASGKKSKKILVTSSVSGEGKTFCALNLASVMALAGKKTIVVGADLRRPRLSDYFNHKDVIGLSTFLIKKAKAEDIIQKTPQENLFFIPAGPVPPNPAELLLSDGLKDLISYLEENYDMIIFDTAPLGLVSETTDLMRSFDLNIYVVRQYYSRKEHLVMINDLYKNQQVGNVYGVFNGMKGVGYYAKGFTYGYGNAYIFADRNKYLGEYYQMEKKKFSFFKWFRKN
ncbi:GumC family protein [Cecembia calidifontis]|jgi:capsular exopolysaccharide synthesis family protein|uniref:non-specific protein-tyrosine kinase n=1 Tax=Cecembia calidifontis TaxID=1187080 RepID=A0A4Q7PD17_9BACT|nr:polysaccharide biosynthesis tyrosine autokinase [Cecembia calidifontis]RZS98251.1 capsular exopolysaccharide synthesis family protein [Cecembia calidifontis]